MHSRRKNQPWTPWGRIIPVSLSFALMLPFGWWIGSNGCAWASTCAVGVESWQLELSEVERVEQGVPELEDITWPENAQLSPLSLAFFDELTMWVGEDPYKTEFGLKLRSTAP